jgi:hydrogenase maturation protease
MARVLVVAIGNPLRCDDGLAWRAADQLKASLSSPDIAIVKLHQLTPEIADTISGFNAVVFVDASVAGKPGDLHAEEVHPADQNGGLAHDLTAAGVLALASVLYEKRPRAILVSMAANSFEHGDFLSPEVIEGLPHLVAKIRELTTALARDGSLEPSQNR